MNTKLIEYKTQALNKDNCSIGVTIFHFRNAQIQVNSLSEMRFLTAGFSLILENDCLRFHSDGSMTA
jgi:hypothetical protein